MYSVLTHNFQRLDTICCHCQLLTTFPMLYSYSISTELIYFMHRSLYLLILSGKEPACRCRGLGFNPCVRKTPWRRKWQPTPGFLPAGSDGQRSLAGYRSPRVGHDWATQHLPCTASPHLPLPAGNHRFALTSVSLFSLFFSLCSRVCFAFQIPQISDIMQSCPSHFSKSMRFSVALCWRFCSL